MLSKKKFQPLNSNEFDETKFHLKCCDIDCLQFLIVLAILITLLQKELITRCCDANERVQEKAEDTLEAMVVNEKIVNSEVLFEELFKPFQVGII